MLGLYKADPSIDSHEPDPGDDLDIPQHDDLDNKGDSVIMPLLLCADAFDASCDISLDNTIRISTAARRETTDEDDSSVQENQDSVSLRRRYELDVPVYIEMMNRTNRTKQRVYVVRTKKRLSTTASPTLTS